MIDFYVNHDLTDDQRREKMFQGNIVLSAQRDQTTALCDHAQRMINEAFAPNPPQQAQFDLRVENFIEIVSKLKSKFTNDQRTKELVVDILANYQCDLQQTYFDVPRLRVVPHGGYLTSGVSYAYKAHRDTWYSSPQCQINYWLPVFPIVPEQAMVIYPHYWHRPIENSSACFDYDEWCNVGRQAAVKQVKEETRKHPLPLEQVDERDGVRIAGGKAEVLMFSAAHLHATVPNESGKTRFSLDFRTINLDDFSSGRGATNLDAAARGSTITDFLRASDFAQFRFDQIRKVA